MQGLRDRTRSDPSFPRVVFVHLGSLEDGRRFFRKRWPEADALADPDGKLFEHFELPRGGVAEVLGPRSWWAGWKAAVQGYFVGEAVGDVWRLPGAFLLEGGEVRWSHRSRFAGDHPDFDEVLRVRGEP